MDKKSICFVIVPTLTTIILNILMITFFNNGQGVLANIITSLMALFVCNVLIKCKENINVQKIKLLIFGIWMLAIVALVRIVNRFDFLTIPDSMNYFFAIAFIGTSIIFLIIFIIDILKMKK